MPMRKQIQQKGDATMRFLINTNDLKDDPTFKRLLGEYSIAKMNLIAYFNRIVSEDISSTPVEAQLQNAKDEE